MSFYMPINLEELEKALQEKDDNTYFCAGGTDLVIQLRARKKFHYSLLDMTHIPEIRQITEEEQQIRIGAGVTMTELEQSSVIRTYIPALAKAASMVGSTQIRNRATLGGNVANASQSSDTTPVLLTYETKAVIFNENGEKRVCPVDDFVDGLGKTKLTDREVILEFLVTKDNACSGFYKVGSRKAVTISKINGCIKTHLSQGSMKDVSVYLGAVGAKAGKAEYIEKALEGKSLSELKEEEIRKAVYDQIEANIPNRSSKHYKKSAAFGVVWQILEDFRGEGM